MTALAFFTWAAIIVLAPGSVAVLLWFVRDAWRMYRTTGKQPPPE